MLHNFYGGEVYLVYCFRTLHKTTSEACMKENDHLQKPARNPIFAFSVLFLAEFSVGLQDMMYQQLLAHWKYLVQIVTLCKIMYIRDSCKNIRKCTKITERWRVAYQQDAVSSLHSDDSTHVHSGIEDSCTVCG